MLNNFNIVLISVIFFQQTLQQILGNSCGGIGVNQQPSNSTVCLNFPVGESQSCCHATVNSTQGNYTACVLLPDAQTQLDQIKDTSGVNLSCKSKIANTCGLSGVDEPKSVTDCTKMKTASLSCCYTSVVSNSGVTYKSCQVTGDKTSKGEDEVRSYLVNLGIGSNINVTCGSDFVSTMYLTFVLIFALFI